MNITDQMIETAVQVLSSEGADTEHGWHGWRCFDKDRYPEPCSCTEDVARAVLEAVAPLIAAQALTKAADELEHVADTLWNRSALRFQGWEHMLSDLRNRADKLEREAGQ